jgi:hypothetical protein
LIRYQTDIYRELVNIVRHLQLYGSDGLIPTLENVFSFDVYDKQLREHLTSIFHNHGIPLGKNKFQIEIVIL